VNRVAEAGDQLAGGAALGDDALRESGQVGVGRRVGERFLEHSGSLVDGAAEAVAKTEQPGPPARQLIWITPEPRWGWALGSCDLPRYEALCDRVEIVRTAEELGGVAERLVSRSAVF